jgi:hypothetical protein
MAIETREFTIQAIESLAVNKQWSWSEGKLNWLDESPQPTDAEIETKKAELKAEWDAQEYARNRKTEYDALNQFELMTDDAANGTTTHADAIDAIKTKYPKP